jgi:catalase
MHDLGVLVLNKNPDDYHRDVEQAAFSPGSMVPGIEASPDMLLQWRTFFYRDTQYYRLGTNMHQMYGRTCVSSDFSPVNCPFMAASYSSPNFAGMLRVDANTGQKPQYTPNSFPDYPKLRGDRETPMKLISNIMSREAPTFIHDTKDSEYDQVSLDDQILVADLRCANSIDVSWMMVLVIISTKTPP